MQILLSVGVTASVFLLILKLQVKCTSFENSTKFIHYVCSFKRYIQGLLVWAPDMKQLLGRLKVNLRIRSNPKLSLFKKSRMSQTVGSTKECQIIELKHKSSVTFDK